MFRIDDKELMSIANEVYKFNKNATLWDVLVAYLAKKGNVDPCIIWILSDIEILQLLARGFDAHTIALILNITPKTVINTAEKWGMYCSPETLDFDPLAIYLARGKLSAIEMKIIVDQISPYGSPSSEIFKLLVENVKKFLELKSLLDDWENEKKGA